MYLGGRQHRLPWASHLCQQFGSPTRQAGNEKRPSSPNGYFWTLCNHWPLLLPLEVCTTLRLHRPPPQRAAKKVPSLGLGEAQEAQGSAMKYDGFAVFGLSYWLFIVTTDWNHRGMEARATLGGCGAPSLLRLPIVQRAGKNL